MTTIWRCPECGRRRQIDLPDSATYAELRRAIRAEHAAASPHCEGAKRIVVSWPGYCSVSWPRNKHDVYN